MIKTDLNEEWRIILECLPPEQRDLILTAAEEVANAISLKRPAARISTNGALEILFAIGCHQNQEMGAVNE